MVLFIILLNRESPGSQLFTAVGLLRGTQLEFRDVTLSSAAFLKLAVQMLPAQGLVGNPRFKRTIIMGVSYNSSSTKLET